jgi:hypothetical protein
MASALQSVLSPSGMNRQIACDLNVVASHLVGHAIRFYILDNVKITTISKWTILIFYGVLPYTFLQQHLFSDGEGGTIIHSFQKPVTLMTSQQ